MTEQENVNVQQQPVQQQQAAPFYPDQVKRTYQMAEWTMKEDWYAKEIQSISIPLSPTPADLANVANHIERVLTTARLDMAFIEQAYDRFNLCMKLEEKELYVDLSITPPLQTAGLKLTVADKEGLVVKTIKNKKWGQSSFNLYDLVKETSSRFTFMSGVIKALCDKKDLLITHSSVIKAEVSLNGFQNNVPQQQAGNY